MRLAFWLALLVLLLPTDAAQQARFTSFASSAMERLSTFCDRNIQTCDVASAAWAGFLRKAEFGMRLVGDLLGVGGRTGPQPDPGMAPQGYKHPAPGKRLGTVPDLYDDGPMPLPAPYQPPWRGPKGPKDF